VTIDEASVLIHGATGGRSGATRWPVQVSVRAKT